MRFFLRSFLWRIALLEVAFGLCIAVLYVLGELPNRTFAESAWLVFWLALAITALAAVMAAISLWENRRTQRHNSN